MADPDFKNYVNGSGVEFDDLSMEDKLRWRESYNSLPGK